jgi:hypothetical protein
MKNAIRFLRGIGHHNPAQEFGEYFAITIDITDRKRAEQERERIPLAGRISISSDPWF